MNVDKKKLKIVYEDALVVAALAEKPAALGHVIVIPKKDFSSFEELDDETIKQLFFVASYTASALFEGLKAEGTNIIINNGSDAGALYDTVYVDVIPRKSDDGLDLKWSPKKIEDSEMASVQEKIKDKTFYIGKKEEKKETVSEPEEPSSDVEKLPEDENNYLMKSLRRIP